MNCVFILDIYTRLEERILLYITICWTLVVFRKVWIRKWRTRNPRLWSCSNRGWVDPEWGTRLTLTGRCIRPTTIQDSTTGDTVPHKLQGVWHTPSPWTLCQCHLVRTIMGPLHIPSQWGHIIKLPHRQEKVTYFISSRLFTFYAELYLKDFRSYLYMFITLIVYTSVT